MKIPEDWDMEKFEKWYDEDYCMKVVSERNIQ